MLFDTITISEGGEVVNATIDSGTAFPLTPSLAEIFYRTDNPNEGLYVYDGTGWMLVGQGGTVSLDSLNIKPAVKAATTTNITLSSAQTIDGVSVITGDRVLVKNQSNSIQNGIYDVDSAGPWTRSSDFDGSPSTEVKAGDFAFVTEGTTNGDTGWLLTTNGTITVGTTSLTFSQFTGTNAGPGGAFGTIQYNGSGSFAGAAGISTDGSDLTLSTGNLTLSANSSRIKGQFTGTAATRTYLQTASDNSDTTVGVLPSGTATASGLASYGTSDPSNSQYVNLATSGTLGGSHITFANIGTAGLNSLAFRTRIGGSVVEVARITSDGAWSFGASGTATGTSNQVLTSNGTGSVPSWQENKPVRLPRATSFTATLADRGNRIVISTSITLPSGTYSGGDAFSFYNSSASPVTITQGSGLTLRQDGTANTGSRTLAAFGTCFVWYNTASEAVISGSVS